MTWYRKDEDLADINDYDIIKGKRTYQYFDRKVLYPFGYGLSYTDFVYGGLQISSETLPKNGELTVSVTVTNKGNYDGYETVQLYLRDIYAEVARPMKELKGFERIFLKSGESRDVKFVITKDDLKFYNSELHYVYEPGEFDVMVGPNSRDVQTKSFQAE